MAQRDYILNMRISEQMKKKLDVMALNAGLTVSEIVRICCMIMFKVQNGDFQIWEEGEMIQDEAEKVMDAYVDLVDAYKF